MKVSNNGKEINLKVKMENILMKSGKKKTGEKILLKFAKRLQKTASKNFKKVVQSAIINSTSTFKISEQNIKKGKRKIVKVTPSFIADDFSRLMSSLKLMKITLAKSQKFSSSYEKLVYEILSSASSKSLTVERKNELQNKVLLNKRYLAKFRW